MRSALPKVLASAVLLLPPGAAMAQAPSSCEPACANTWITEASYARRVAGGPSRPNGGIFGAYEYGEAGAWHLTATTGIVHGVSRRVGIGAVVSAGLWSELYASLGARLRLGLSPEVTLDLTPTVVIAGDDVEVPDAMLDASVMWRDRIGVSVQAGAITAYTYRPDPPPGDPYTTTRRRLAMSAGIRLGEVPGRIGILADAAALAGLFGVYLLYCGGGCD